MNLGLDELMIVNPASGGLRAVFLGRDGSLYGVEDVHHRHHPRNGRGRSFARLAGPADSARYFLGEDGTLYERVAE
jgi:hypothetical protein